MMQWKGRLAADRKEEGAKETLALSGMGCAIMEGTHSTEYSYNSRAPARGRVRSVAILDVWCLGFGFIMAPDSWTQNAGEHGPLVGESH